MRSIITRMTLLFLVFLGMVFGCIYLLTAVIHQRTLQETGGIAGREASDFIRNEWVRQARSLTELYAEQLVQPVYNMDLEDIRDLASAVKALGVMVSIHVLDADGMILSDGSHDSARTGLLYEHDIASNPSLLIVRSPVKVGSRVIGSVVAEFDTSGARLAGERLDARIRDAYVMGLSQSRNLLALLFTIAAAAGVLGAFLLSRGISRRINAIEDAVEQLARHDYDIDPGKSSRDEIGRLGATLKRVAQALRDSTVSSEYLETVLNCLPVGVSVTGKDGKTQISNPCFNSLCGIEQAAGMQFGEATGLAPDCARDLVEAVKHKGRLSGLEIALSPNGSQIDAHLLAVRLSGNGHPTKGKLLFVVHDISERKVFERKLFHLASQDHLTGMANRRTILEAIDRELRLFRKDADNAFWLVFVDLDGFKLVNDRYGHNIGDEVLKTISKRLLGIIREGDEAGRMGGDEFLILLRGAMSMDAAFDAGGRFLECVRAPIVLEGLSIRLSASVGLVRCCQRHASAGAIVAEADKAMYEAKRRGKDRLLIFSHDERTDGMETAASGAAPCAATEAAREELS